MDLENVEVTKEPEQYTRQPVVLPKALWPYFVRDETKQEFVVYGKDGRTIVWRRSFADLAAPSP